MMLLCSRSPADAPARGLAETARSWPAVTTSTMRSLACRICLRVGPAGSPGLYPLSRLYTPPHHATSNPLRRRERSAGGPDVDGAASNGSPLAGHT